MKKNLPYSLALFILITVGPVVKAGETEEVLYQNEDLKIVNKEGNLTIQDKILNNQRKIDPSLKQGGEPPVIQRIDNQIVILKKYLPTESNAENEEGEKEHKNRINAFINSMVLYNQDHLADDKKATVEINIACEIASVIGKTQYQFDDIVKGLVKLYGLDKKDKKEVRDKLFNSFGTKTKLPLDFDHLSFSLFPIILENSIPKLFIIPAQSTENDIDRFIQNYSDFLLKEKDSSNTKLKEIGLFYINLKDVLNYTPTENVRANLELRTVSILEKKPEEYFINENIKGFWFCQIKTLDELREFNSRIKKIHRLLTKKPYYSFFVIIPFLFLIKYLAQCKFY